MDDSYIALSKYFKRPDFTFFDFGTTLFVFIVILFIATRIKAKHPRSSYYQKYFIPGLIVKMLGGLGYALVYTYYYTYGGDTSGYWGFGVRVCRVLFDYPEYWWGVFSRDFATSESFVLGMLKSMSFARNMEEYRMVQITSLIAPFGFMNFFASTVLLAGIAYTGMWRMFLVFREKFPQVEKGLAISVLFIPSTFFWGSGIMKDTVVLSSLGLLIYGLNYLFTRGLWNIGNLLVISLAVFLIFSIKAYILFSLIPGVILWRTFRLKEKIKNRYLRRFAIPIFISVALIGSLYAIDYVGQFNPLYKVENFIAGAQSMQNWHYQEGANTSEQYGRGSSYTLGAYAPTPMGVLKMFPAAVNVTLFRPYPWEVNTIMQMFSALESQILFLFAFFVLIWSGPRRVLSVINNDPFLMLMLSFSLIFAFGVGFSAYNFGALARYKIPSIPFFVGALFVIRYKVSKEKGLKKQRAINREIRERMESKHRYVG